MYIINFYPFTQHPISLYDSNSGIQFCEFPLTLNVNTCKTLTRNSPTVLSKREKHVNGDNFRQISKSLESKPLPKFISSV